MFVNRFDYLKKDGFMADYNNHDDGETKTTPEDFNGFQGMHFSSSSLRALSLSHVQQSATPLYHRSICVMHNTTLIMFSCRLFAMVRRSESLLAT